MPDELLDALNLIGVLSDLDRVPEHWPGLLAGLVEQGRAVACSFAERTLWLAQERAPEWLLLHPKAQVVGGAIAPVALTPETALQELLRSRLEVSVLITAGQLATMLALPETQIEAALLALEQLGVAMRHEYAWCDRALLARLQRYSKPQPRVARFTPMAAEAYQKFLLSWQGLVQKSQDVSEVLNKLEGFPLPAASWERLVLPARIEHYRLGLIDPLFSQGQWLWLKLNAKAPTPGKRLQAARKNTAITLIHRRHLAEWRYRWSTELTDDCLSGPARKLIASLRDQGASFRFDLAADTGLLPYELEQGLAELVNLGLISCDSFQGLRNILGKHRQPDDLGRWFLLKTAPESQTLRFDSALYIARVLLKRYGVLFRVLLENEACAPPWRALLYACRRLEASGEVLTGRFVLGQTGEQFALPEAARLLAETGQTALTFSELTLSAADPVNLTSVLPLAETIAKSGNRCMRLEGSGKLICQNSAPPLFNSKRLKRAGSRYLWHSKHSAK